MDGRPKGLLPSPAPATEVPLSLVERLAREFVVVAAGARVVLVGRHDAYAALPFPQLDDAPPGIGPLGGLRALLVEGAQQDAVVVACSCDLPFLGASLFARLLQTAPQAVAVAPSRGGRLEPFPARYDAARALPLVEAALRDGKRSLKDVLAACSVATLELQTNELRELDDWDTPEDVAATRSS